MEICELNRNGGNDKAAKNIYKKPVVVEIGDANDVTQGTLGGPNNDTGTVAGPLGDPDS